MSTILSPIRVCSVDEEGRFGGPENRITQIAKALHTRGSGVETHVVYPLDDSGRFAQELSKNKVPCTAINLTRLSKEPKVFAKYLFRFFFEIYSLYSFFRKGKYDLVQVNGSQQFKGALAAKLAGIPVVWVLEDALMNPLVRKTCIFLAEHIAAGLIVVGKRVSDYYILGTSLEAKHIAEIHPPVDTAMFNPHNILSAEILHQLPGRKIVTVAGINPTKGLEYFIGMASELIKRHGDLVFLVAAPNINSQKGYFQQLLKLLEASELSDKNFRFLGMVDDVPGLLQGADIFVCTSVSESGPMAVWEAMAMGKAIVTTDVGSVSQYLVNGESAFIVPIQDSRSLAEKVEVLLNAPALRQEMGGRVRDIARERLDVTIAAGKYADFYRDVVNAEKRSETHYGSKAISNLF